MVIYKVSHPTSCLDDLPILYNRLLEVEKIVKDATLRRRMHLSYLKLPIPMQKTEDELEALHTILCHHGWVRITMESLFSSQTWEQKVEVFNALPSIKPQWCRPTPLWNALLDRGFIPSILNMLSLCPTVHTPEVQMLLALIQAYLLHLLGNYRTRPLTLKHRQILHNCDMDPVIALMDVVALEDAAACADVTATRVSKPRQLLLRVHRMLCSRFRPRFYQAATQMRAQLLSQIEMLESYDSMERVTRDYPSVSPSTLLRLLHTRGTHLAEVASLFQGPMAGCLRAPSQWEEAEVPSPIDALVGENYQLELRVLRMRHRIETMLLAQLPPGTARPPFWPESVREWTRDPYLQPGSCVIDPDTQKRYDAADAYCLKSFVTAAGDTVTMTDRIYAHRDRLVEFSLKVEVEVGDWLNIDTLCRVEQLLQHPHICAMSQASGLFRRLELALQASTSELHMLVTLECLQKCITVGWHVYSFSCAHTMSDTLEAVMMSTYADDEDVMGAACYTFIVMGNYEMQRTQRPLRFPRVLPRLLRHMLRSRVSFAHTLTILIAGWPFESEEAATMYPVLAEAARLYTEFSGEMEQRDFIDKSIEISDIWAAFLCKVSRLTSEDQQRWWKGLYRAGAPLDVLWHFQASMLGSDATLYSMINHLSDEPGLKPPTGQGDVVARFVGRIVRHPSPEAYRALAVVSADPRVRTQVRRHPEMADSMLTMCEADVVQTLLDIYVRGEGDDEEEEEEEEEGRGAAAATAAAAPVSEGERRLEERFRQLIRK